MELVKIVMDQRKKKGAHGFFVGGDINIEVGRWRRRTLWSSQTIGTAAVSSNFFAMTVLKDSGGKRRRVGDGWHVKSEWKRFLPTLSPLMVGRSGAVVAIQRPTWGQGRNIEGAKKHSVNVAREVQASGPSEGAAELLGPVFVRRVRRKDFGTQGPLECADRITRTEKVKKLDKERWENMFGEVRGSW